MVTHLPTMTEIRRRFPIVDVSRETKTMHGGSEMTHREAQIREYENQILAIADDLDDDDDSETAGYLRIGAAGIRRRREEKNEAGQASLASREDG